MRPLTRKQAVCLQAISARLETGKAPSVRELCADLGVASTNTVASHLNRLRAYGLIDWTPTARRSIRMVKI